MYASRLRKTGFPGGLRRRGVILIVTLWVLVVLSSVALTYAYYARLDLETTRYASNSARARYLAKAGYYQACIYLRDDKLKDMDPLSNPRQERRRAQEAQATAGEEGPQTAPQIDAK